MSDKLKNTIFSEKTALISILIGFVIFIISALIFFTKGSWSFSLNSEISEEKIGQYGDFIGGIIGSLFSLVGVILFYVALKEQRKDFATSQETLKVQLEAFQQQVREFEAQREELEETRKVFEQQNKTMKNQQFDSNFYSLLNVFIKQREKFSENYFVELAQNLKDKVGIENDFIEICHSLNNEYLNLYLSNRAKLALYFMTLYRLYKVIEDCDHLSIKERISYHKILRSIITKDELLILYYNYHSSFGKKPLPIVLKYDYFKHLETLSKIEFSHMFSLNTTELTQANSVVDKVTLLLSKNILLAQDINSENIREEIELQNGVHIGVYIEDEIEVRLFISNNINDIINYNKEKFAHFIECILIDVLFHSKFIVFKSEYLKRSTTTNSEKTIFNNTFTNFK
jgi:hypothetical protein